MVRDTIERNDDASLSYGTRLVASGVYVLHSSDDAPVRITETDPSLAHVLFDPSTAYALGDGVYKIDF